MSFNKEQKRLNICPNCEKPIDRIFFSAHMVEEWTWDGYNWECTATTSLVNDYHMPVRCADCGNIVGKGSDFGFGKN